MFIKKNDPNLQQDDNTVCYILLTPVPDRTYQEALNLLNQLGAKHIEQLSSEFISAEVKKNVLPQLKELARVEVKHPYQMN